MLHTTSEGTGNAQIDLQGTNTTYRLPTNRPMPPMQNHITTKHPMTLLMLLNTVCHQYTIHHQVPYLVLLSIPQLPGTFQKTEFGITSIFKLT